MYQCISASGEDESNIPRDSIGRAAGQALHCNAKPFITGYRKHCSRMGHSLKPSMMTVGRPSEVKAPSLYRDGLHSGSQ